MSVVWCKNWNKKNENSIRVACNYFGLWWNESKTRLSSTMFMSSSDICDRKIKQKLTNVLLSQLFFFFPEFSFVLFIMFFLLSIPSEFFWNSIQNVFKRIKFFHFVVCLYVYRYTISVWKKMSFSCFVFLESKREVFLCQSNGHFKEGKKKLNWDRDRKIRGRGANHLHIINDGIHTH